MKLSGIKYLTDQGVENIWKNKMMAFAATWMQLQILVLSEEVRKTNTIYHLYVESKICHK